MLMSTRGCVGIYWVGVVFRGIIPFGLAPKQDSRKDEGDSGGRRVSIPRMLDSGG